MSCNNCCPPIIFGAGKPPCVSPGSETVLTVDGDGCLGLITDPDGPVRPGENGLTVCVSAQEDNTLTQDADGCLYVPEADEPPPLVTGCGITGTGDAAGPLTAATSGQWGAGPLGFPCDDTNGQPVYCDTAGQLRTVPARYTRGFASNQGESLDGPPEETGTVRLLFDIQLDVTNPSTCRDMMAQTRVNVNGITWTQTAGNEWALSWGISYSNDGSQPALPGPQQVLIQRRIPDDQTSADTIKWGVIDAPVSGGGFGYIGAGQTVTARAALYLDFIATNLSPGADGRAPSWAANWFELYAEGHSL